MMMMKEGKTERKKARRDLSIKFMLSSNACLNGRAVEMPLGSSLFSCSIASITLLSTIIHPGDTRRQSFSQKNKIDKWMTWLVSSAQSGATGFHLDYSSVNKCGRLAMKMKGWRRRGRILHIRTTPQHGATQAEAQLAALAPLAAPVIDDGCGWNRFPTAVLLIRLRLNLGYLLRFR